MQGSLPPHTPLRRRPASVKARRETKRGAETRGRPASARTRQPVAPPRRARGFTRVRNVEGVPTPAVPGPRAPAPLALVLDADGAAFTNTAPKSPLAGAGLAPTAPQPYLAPIAANPTCPPPRQRRTKRADVGDDDVLLAHLARLLPHTRRAAAPRLQDLRRTLTPNALTAGDWGATLRGRLARRQRSAAEQLAARTAQAAGSEPPPRPPSWNASSSAPTSFAVMAVQGRNATAVALRTGAAPPTLRASSAPPTAATPFPSAMQARLGEKRIPHAASCRAQDATACSYARPRSGRRPATSAGALGRLLPYANAEAALASGAATGRLPPAQDVTGEQTHLWRADSYFMAANGNARTAKLRAATRALTRSARADRAPAQK